MLEYFRAQEVQDPVLLDTGWLWIGHVDEFVQFLPANTERGWVMMVADPKAALSLLQKAQEDGYGSTDIVSRSNKQTLRHATGSNGKTVQEKMSPPTYSKGTNKAVQSLNHTTSLDGDWNESMEIDIGDNDDMVNIPNPYTTIDSALADEKLHTFNSAYQKRIEANIEILKDATGITDSEIYRIPTLFQQLDRDKLLYVGPRPSEETLCAGALWPGIINGVVLTGSETYLAPKPWGPVIDGRDMVEDAVKKIYEDIGWKVKWIDDWDSHHKLGGEVHCGTNTIREMSGP
jgi:protein-arginine deiminase